MSQIADGKPGKDRTKMKADHQQVAIYLENRHRFATMRDNDDIYVYDKVKGYIRRDTYVERAEFNARTDSILVKNGVLDLTQPGKSSLLFFSLDYLFVVGFGVGCDFGVWCLGVVLSRVLGSGVGKG